MLLKRLTCVEPLPWPDTAVNTAQVTLLTFVTTQKALREALLVIYPASYPASSSLRTFGVVRGNVTMKLTYKPPLQRF